MKPPSYAASRPEMCGRDRVCCESHTARWMPAPETDAEREAVAKALARWDDEFWLIEPLLAVPGYVTDLWPAGVIESWPTQAELEPRRVDA